jgi:hypothetical protein
MSSMMAANNYKKPSENERLYNSSSEEHDELFRVRTNISNSASLPQPSLLMAKVNARTTLLTPTTKSASTTTTTQTSTPTAPLSYKLNINDTYSKALLDNINGRSRYNGALKPADKLNIWIKKPAQSATQDDPGKVGQLIIDTNQPNQQQYNSNSASVAKSSNPGAQIIDKLNKLNPIVLQQKVNKQDYLHMTTR